MICTSEIVRFGYNNLYFCSYKVTTTNINTHFSCPSENKSDPKIY